jgi:hypothetical protein
MSFSDDNNLEIPTSGVADWDSPLNGNFNALARGFQFAGIAGQAVNTGNAVCVIGAFVHPYDASSRDCPRPVGLSRTGLGSGDAGQFQIDGTIRSLDIWSGHFTVGERVYVDPASVGFLTNSYSAAKYPVGWALAEDAVLIRPENFEPEKVTQTVSFAWIVGSAHAFTLEIGERGMVHEFEIISNSVDAYKVQFWTGSARVNSEELYETVTTSIDGAALDYDVATLNYRDRSTWSYWNTDTTSPGLIFGTITVQSASAVGSGDASVTFLVERMA